MAYFPNATAGDHLDRQCDECLHQNDDIGCPIAAVQMMFNYTQLDDGQEKLAEAMNILIDEKGNCQMKPLIDKYLPDSTQGNLF